MKPERILDFHSHFPEPKRKCRGITVQGEGWAAEVQNNHLEKVVFEEMNAIFYRNRATLLGIENED